MPNIRITSDIRSLLYLDGKQLCTLQPNAQYECQVSVDDHFISVVSIYNEKLRYNSIVNVLHDQVLVFNFSELIKDNPDLLNDLELFRYKIEDKYGYFEPITRSIIIEPQYDSIDHFSNEGLAIAEKNHAKGVINKKGKIVIPFDYDRITLSNDLYRVEQGSNVGYIDYNGRFYIEMQDIDVRFVYQYEDFRPTSLLGYYRKRGEYNVFYNTKGRAIICGNFDSFDSTSHYIIGIQGKKSHVFNIDGQFQFSTDLKIDFKEVAFVVHNNESKYGILDTNGNWLVHLEYDTIWSYPNGFFQLKKNDAPNDYIIQYDGCNLKTRLITAEYRLGNYFFKKQDNFVVLIDMKRNTEHRIECDGVKLLDGDYSGECSEYLMIEKASENEWQTSKYGLVRVSSTLEYLTDCKYDTIYKFYNGYACVKEGSCYGAIDERGNLVIPCTYYKEFFFRENGYAEVYKVERFWLGGFLYLGYGIIDSSNNTIIGFDRYKSIYWERSSFNDRSTCPLVRVEKDDTTYLLDYSNKVVATYGPEYQFLGILPCDCSVYLKSDNDGKYLQGHIDKFGQLIIPCKFKEISEVTNQLFKCKLTDKYALYDTHGIQLTDYEFDRIEKSESEFMLARKGDYYGIINNKAEEILSFTFSSIRSFYKNEPIDVDINSLYDWDTDEDGNAYAIFGADDEGPFRYGITSAMKAGSKNFEFYGDDGKKIVLRKLGESLQVKPYNPFEGLAALFINDIFEKIVKVAGVTYGNRQYYISTIKSNEKLELKREKYNEYDSNAVAVYDLRGHHLGYIPKSEAGEIARRLDKGEIMNVCAVEILGGADMNYGLKIRITN